MKLEVEVTIYSDKNQIINNQGTLMFTHYGLSAPVVLEISRTIAEEILIKKNSISISINFLPNIPKEKLDKFIVDRWAKSPNKSLGFSFVGLLPKKVFPAILKENYIDPEIKCSEISKKMRLTIIELLSNYKLKVQSVRDINEAHFTAGGVSTKEIDPKTLESKILDNLYFCGEVIDIDGDCGGYNLQWAWSSGAVVGMSV